MVFHRVEIGKLCSALDGEVIPGEDVRVIGAAGPRLNLDTLASIMRWELGLGALAREAREGYTLGSQPDGTLVLAHWRTRREHPEHPVHRRLYWMGRVLHGAGTPWEIYSADAAQPLRGLDVAAIRALAPLPSVPLLPPILTPAAGPILAPTTSPAELFARVSAEWRRADSSARLAVWGGGEAACGQFRWAVPGERVTISHRRDDAPSTERSSGPSGPETDLGRAVQAGEAPFWHLQRSPGLSLPEGLWAQFASYLDARIRDQLQDHEDLRALEARPRLWLRWLAGSRTFRALATHEAWRDVFEEADREFPAEAQRRRTAG